MMDLSEHLKLINRMMDKNFDWEKHDEENGLDFQSQFRQCYRWHDYRDGERPIGTVACGSIKFKDEDTPKAMYRIFWLLEPDHVDFSDMYKDELLSIVSHDYRFVASFYLWKYEASLYFSCDPAVAKRTKPKTGIRCNVPGYNMGIVCDDQVGNLWFEILQKVLETRHCVYGGNNFFV